MKRIILMLLTACMALGMTAQDTIVRKDGETIPAKVLEVSGTHVKYKRFSNPDGQRNNKQSNCQQQATRFPFDADI